MSPKQEIESRLLDLAYRNILPMLFVNISASIGVTFVLVVNGEAWAKMWLAAMAIVTLVRALAWFAYHRVSGGRELGSISAVRLWHRIYTIGLYISGLSWAVLSCTSLNTTSMNAKYTVIIIIAALAGGATGVTAPLLREGRFYIISLLLPGSVFLAVGDLDEVVLSALGVIFLAVMVLGHRNNHRILRQSLELQSRNDGLLQDLKLLNLSLEDKIAERTEALRAIAHRDGLTDLPNRRALVEWMEDNLDAEKPGEAAVLFLDLDRFKQINDAMGHDVGDQVLRGVARHFRARLPDSVMLARWGGDEFVAVTTQGADMRALASALAEDLIASVADEFRINDQATGLGVSIGRAFFPTDAATFAEAIQLADLAVAEVKRNERGTLLDFHEVFADTQKRRFDLSRALGLAIADGDLELAYQPIVDAHSGQVKAYEALARWQHPDLGAIPPDEFIRLAEETDRIGQLGDFVLVRSCRDAMRWALRGIDAKVAVNVSVRQLRMTGFVDRVQEILLASGLPASKLEIEVTESVFDDVGADRVLDTVRRLHNIGIEIHIDDFGTGYSSLSRLHRFPVHAIKIDQSFVRAMDNGGRAIIQGAIMIARQFGFKVTAEGVETEDQARALLAMGVDAFQGYLVSRPLAKVETNAYPAVWTGERTRASA